MAFGPDDPDDDDGGDAGDCSCDEPLLLLDPVPFVLPAEPLPFEPLPFEPLPFEPLPFEPLTAPLELEPEEPFA